jgi:hypothetical protein
MVNLAALLHDRKYFSLDYIAQQQTQYNFTQSVKVETFLWNLEIFGQLQRHLENKVILKGGAAAQLYFPPDRQRTSVDIDVIYTGDNARLIQALKAIHKSFGEDTTYFKFNQYIPQNPKTVLPLDTYFMAVPACTIPKAPLNIKIDFHLMESNPFETVEINNAQAFIIPLAFRPLCLSAGTLFGDKILTLAQGSLGIPPEREDDIVKQLYDLDLLSRIVQESETAALRNAMDILYKRELEIRKVRIEFSLALQQMIRLLDKYSILDSAKSDRVARDAINHFRSNYEPRPFRSSQDWGITAKRLQFFVRALEANVEQPISRLAEADSLLRMLAFESNDHRGEIRKQLATEFTAQLRDNGNADAAKRLKNTSPERIFWERVNPHNLEQVKTSILSKTIKPSI